MQRSHDFRINQSAFPHGLTIPPVCHQDDVLKTAIRPGDPPFEYRFRIPESEPPGLYWYHPHIHGFTKAQVLGGASGALIVEGIEQADKAVAGLPERVLIIRDQDLLNPNAPPAKWEPVVPKTLIDRDGDAANNGTGYGKPAKDLSINFVPAPYPDYRPAVIEMKTGEQQLWRVLNARESPTSTCNFYMVKRRNHWPRGDGRGASTKMAWHEILSTNAFRIPPGARMEFIVKRAPSGLSGLSSQTRRYRPKRRERSQSCDCHGRNFDDRSFSCGRTFLNFGVPCPFRRHSCSGWAVRSSADSKLYFSESLY